MPKYAGKNHKVGEFLKREHEIVKQTCWGREDVVKKKIGRDRDGEVMCVKHEDYKK